MDPTKDDRFREIKKKLLILENRKPYDREVAKYIDEINQLDWIYSSMRLDGSSITRENVAKISGGAFIIDASIEEHNTVIQYKQTLRLAYSMAEMDMDLDQKCIFRLYGSLYDPKDAQYRQNNPVLLPLAYNPPHFYEIEEQMDIFLKWLSSEEYANNPIRKAVGLHHRFLEIYPFADHSEAMARLLMLYQMMRSGYSPFLFSVSEQEYNDMIRLYLKREEMEPFYEAVERSVYNQLRFMMQLTARE